jgi:phosphatidylinositol glycan class V
VLYQIALALPLGPKERKASLAFIAAALHIIAPAGIFLVAPYTEAPFSLLNFAGQLFYIYSWSNASPQQHGLAQDIYLLLCGVCFGLAATVRGNGLLSGIILFYDAALWFTLQAEALLGIRVLNTRRVPLALQAQSKMFGYRRLPANILAGLFVAVGFVAPQLIAYQEYCAGALVDKRPWCHKFPPSIYSWVQIHYWCVRCSCLCCIHLLSQERGFA